MWPHLFRLEVKHYAVETLAQRYLVDFAARFTDHIEEFELIRELSIRKSLTEMFAGK